MMEDLKLNLRKSLEQNTGFVGEAMARQRREANKEKEIVAKLQQIDKANTPIKTSKNALSSIEASFIQISENLQLINQWADAQSTTFEETKASLEPQVQTKVVEKQQAEEKEVTPPAAPDLNFNFDSLLGPWKKIKLPKINFKKLKAKFAKQLSKLGKGVAEGAKGVAKVLNKAPIGKAAAVVTGVAILGYGAKKAVDAFKESKAAPENVDKANAAQEKEYGKTQPESVATPVSKPAPAAQTKAAPTPAAPTPAAPAPAPAPGAAPAGPAPSAAPLMAPMVKSPDTIPAEPTPPSTGGDLSSSTTKQNGVILQGMNKGFESRVAAMASEFQQKTNRKLLITSGVRSNEKQQQLWFAKMDSLGGEDKLTALGGGSLYTGARKAGLTSKVAPPVAPLGINRGNTIFAPGKGSKHLQGLAIDINSKGESGINAMAGTRVASTGFLEKFGLHRPVPNEDWHIEPIGSTGPGDAGMVASAQGAPIDPGTGKIQPLPTDSTTGKQLYDGSKSVDQLRRDRPRGTETMIVYNSHTQGVIRKKVKPQSETVGALG